LLTLIIRPPFFEDKTCKCQCILLMRTNEGEPNNSTKRKKNCPVGTREVGSELLSRNLTQHSTPLNSQHHSTHSTHSAVGSPDGTADMLTDCSVRRECCASVLSRRSRGPKGCDLRLSSFEDPQSDLLFHSTSPLFHCFFFPSFSTMSSTVADTISKLISENAVMVFSKSYW